MGALDRYLHHHSRVDGWLDSFSANFIAGIAKTQEEAGFEGGLAEIGVHRGRLFILLKLLARPSERALAIDIFGDQHHNVDKSGNGDLYILRANLRKWAGSDDIEIIQNSSLEVRPADIVARSGRCRLFSIDGGHTAACTLNDLRLADASLADNGVVILDDYFNPSWPDVSTGTAQYLQDPAARLRPFAISPNKLYLASVESHDFYSANLRRVHADFFEKESEMFGVPVLVFGVDPETHRPSRRFKRWLKGTAAGPLLLQARRRFWAHSLSPQRGA
jgi:Methyltransferase domain